MNSRDALFDAIHGRSNPKTPVWFMRQAGRLFPEYRALREDYDFKELCRNEKLNARVTCMPVERLGVDAAIIFSDILLPLESVGAGFELVPGEGPVLDRTVESMNDVRELSAGSPRQDLDYVLEAIEASIDRLPEDVPLIGFAGAPFTLASYLVEGGKSRNHMKTRNFMLNEPEAWDRLMDLLVDLTIPYLEGQVEAGAEILQLFDSWVGQLSPPLYEERVLPHTERIVEAVDGPPLIHFGTKTAGLLPLIEKLDVDVLGIDWRIDVATARNQLSDPPCLQGNLDPGLLLNDFPSVKPYVDRILEQASPAGHVFNLGHGILPETQPEVVEKLVEYVHSQPRGPDEN